MRTDLAHILLDAAQELSESGSQRANTLAHQLREAAELIHLVKAGEDPGQSFLEHYKIEAVVTRA